MSPTPAPPCARMKSSRSSTPLRLRSPGTTALMSWPCAAGRSPCSRRSRCPTSCAAGSRADTRGSTASCAGWRRAARVRSWVAPRVVPKQPHGSTFESSARSPLMLRDERRIVADVQPGAEALAQIEQAEPGADRRLAVAVDVPRDTEPRREVVLRLRNSERFGPWRAAAGALPARTSPLPGACSRPLHGSVPSAGLNAAGSKLMIRLSSAYGLKNSE